MDLERLAAIVGSARAEGRHVLLEPEGLDLLASIGIPTPVHLFIRDIAEISSLDTSAFPGNHVVVKLVSPEVSHKSDVGGVVFVPNDRGSIDAAVQKLAATTNERDVRGFLIVEQIDYDKSLGGELLFGIRWTDEYGPIVVFGAGGVQTELLAESLKPGLDLAVASSDMINEETAAELLRGVAVSRLVCDGVRGQPPRLERRALIELFIKFAALARQTVPGQISELEVNPFAVVEGRLMALDVWARCDLRPASRHLDRPTHKLRNLLVPDSIGIIGVSERMNPGRVILENSILAGFPAQRIYVIKADTDSIAGCPCVPDVSSLPERVDLLVMAVSAAQIPELLEQVIEGKKAESVIVIPGGLEEREGSESIVARIRSAVERARSSDWGGPVINGGNCLGIRSEPGRYDTMFIPQYKLPAADGSAYPIALIAQSGAFAVAKSSKLGLRSRYIISVGNQSDLTIGDYIEFLRSDPVVEIFAVYAEGFRYLDGLKFLKAAKGIIASGKTVILYGSGRTPEGAAASASHTASLASDYTITRELARNAGVIVCDTTADFEDLLRLSAFLGAERRLGARLGAVSNAGFECVTMVDHLGPFALAQFSQQTRVGF